MLYGIGELLEAVIVNSANCRWVNWHITRALFGFLSHKKSGRVCGVLPFPIERNCHWKLCVVASDLSSAARLAATSILLSLRKWLSEKTQKCGRQNELSVSRSIPPLKKTIAPAVRLTLAGTSPFRLSAAPAGAHK